VVGARTTVFNSSVVEFPTGIAFQANGGYGGAFAVSIEQQNGSSASHTNYGYVAIENPTNTVLSFGPCYGSSISDLETVDGFLLTYASPPGTSNFAHIYGLRGGYY